MAEIKIEKKTTVWPWVLLGILLVAAILYFTVFNDDDDVEELDTTAVAAPVTDYGADNNDAVASYVTFINNDTSSMGLDHNYTNEALSKLIMAVQSVADKKGMDVKADVDQLNSYADEIMKDPFVNTHADKIRKATDALANTLQNLQAAHYPQLNAEMANLKQASSDIDPNVLTLEQKADVKGFFNQAADVLSKMN